METKLLAAGVLRKARNIVHKWTRQLEHTIATMESDSIYLRKILFRVATVSRMSYDVDEEDLGLVLGTADIGAAIDCAIIIHDNAPDTNLSVLDQSLLDRNNLLSQRLERHLYNLIVEDVLGGKEMDKCIARAWATFIPTDTWLSLSGDNQRWIMTTMRSSEGEVREVHYNLLEGELLINGTLLKRLPEDFLKHSLYKRTFGSVRSGSLNTNFQILNYRTESF